MPAGATISSHPAGLGENDTSIVVTFNSSFVSGAISVQGVNFCGSNAPRMISLSRKVSGTPGAISGATAVCAFKQSPGNPSGTAVDYTIRKVLYATSYSWTLPPGASATHPGGSGVNDTIITVTYSSSFTGGNISVQSHTNCSSSALRSLAIPYLLPYTPGTVTASTPSACPQRRVTYSLAVMPSRATSVLWTVPASGTIISGQGTLNLVVEFAGTTTVTDTIRVVGVNDCGIGPQRKLRAAILGACRPAERSIEEQAAIPVTKTKNQLSNHNAELKMIAMPNPAQRQFTIQLSGDDNTTLIGIRITDATGRLIESKQHILNNQTIFLGNNYRPGMYFAQFLQGEKRRVIRLIKQ